MTAAVLILYSVSILSGLLGNLFKLALVGMIYLKQMPLSMALQLSMSCP